MLLLCNAHEDKYKVKPEEKRIVHYYSFRPRKLDRVNLVASFKYLEDQLQRMGLIWRDSPKYLESKFYQYKEIKNPRTEIIIFLVEED